MNNISVAFCVNDAYSPQLATTIVSILENNKNSFFDFYVFSSDFSDKSVKAINYLKKVYHNFNLKVMNVDKHIFSSLKINITHISIETYYRYMIAELLPDLDKILYLDADLVVNGDISDLWQTNIDNCYLAGVSDFYINQIKHKSFINFYEDDLYINAGVLLMNLRGMRQDKIGHVLLQKTQELWDKIKFQDQDIINIVCKNKIKEVDCVYNFATDNAKSKKYKKYAPVILHYTGCKKPWHLECENPKAFVWRAYYTKTYALLKNKINNCLTYSQLKFVLYKLKKFLFRTKKSPDGTIRITMFNIRVLKFKLNKKVRVALLIDEFFGVAGTAFGGYGFLARKYIAKYIPDKNIKIDILLNTKGYRRFAKKSKVDGVCLYNLPKKDAYAAKWLKRKNYDIYLSIELTNPCYEVLKCEPNKDKKLILWIQDPRPQYEWDEIETVKLFPEKSYYSQKVYDFVHDWHENGRIKFVSQGYFLNPKAKDLYRLKGDVKIDYLPNPVDIDPNFDVQTAHKKNDIIFLGRIESVKRGWLFCEIAKRMPEYNFYVLGQTFREKDKNSEVMKPYYNIKNLHFMGHVDGEEKAKYLKEAKILVNTSIHEALPVSFLEALAYGDLLVSNRNPEDLTSKFGVWVGDVLGDGFDKVDLYVNAIQELVSNDKKRQELSINARKYVEKIHNVPKFVEDLRRIIFEEIGSE